jgi:hypothetical protein
VPAQGRYQSVNLALPPLAMLCLRAPPVARAPLEPPPPGGVH